MFNQKFFKEVLPERHSAKSMESPDGEQGSVVMTLLDGSAVRIASLVEANLGWVVLKVYPPSGRLREFKRDKGDKGPRFDLDQLAITYESIQKIEFTLAGKKHQPGFGTL